MKLSSPISSPMSLNTLLAFPFMQLHFLQFKTIRVRDKTPIINNEQINKILNMLQQSFSIKTLPFCHNRQSAPIYLVHADIIPQKLLIIQCERCEVAAVF